MKKLLVLGALAIFLAAHGAVTAMTIYPQLDEYNCDGSNCWACEEVVMKEFFMLLVAMTIMASAATVVTAHPSSAVVTCYDCSGASW
jgi:hypothetical protein